MKEEITFTGLYLAFVALIIGSALGGARLCNNAFNNKTVTKPAYQMNSYATGITGHTELIRYKTGAQDVKIYPGLGHRFWDSELYQDFNGDGLVDRIIKNGAEWKMNSLSELLVREEDYNTKHGKKRFDEADKYLSKLVKKYPRKI